MNGLLQRATVHAAALAAVTHWQLRFDERKARWIAATAAQPYRPGLFRKERPIGLTLATECFDGSWTLGDDGLPERAFSGAYWPESAKLIIAERVAALTANGEEMSVLLTTEELTALNPVWKPGDEPISYRCKRCGQSDAEARAAGCSMAPCPMEVAS